MELHYEIYYSKFKISELAKRVASCIESGIESIDREGGLQLFPCTLQHCVHTRYPPVTRQLCAALLHRYLQKSFLIVSAKID